ncbi:hypothetical protein [Actinomadura fulvescens]|uniref:hypothetical protein n=1 Tax=Actinomadura fulvescens TaxID=46160 RepID=UPI0031E47D1B
MDRYSWLPDHQQHVVYSLAHADDLIARTGQLVLDYTEPGALELDNIRSGDREEVVVTGVAPLPQGIVRLAADALNQLRSVLEHIVYAELTHLANGSLTDQQARSIEMPATNSADSYLQWGHAGPSRQAGRAATRSAPARAHR